MLELAKFTGRALEIAKTFGNVINTQLPAPIELQRIANLELADPGERVYTYKAYDTDAGEILSVDSDGSITVVKKTPLDDSVLCFDGFQSKLEWVPIDVLLSKSDQDLIARRKRIMTDNLDKKEVKLVLDGIVSAASGSFADTYIQTVSGQSSANDLYDVFYNMIEKVEDFGDGYELLLGTSVYKEYQKYDKVKAESHNYKVGLKQFLKDNNVNVTKVFGKVRVSDGGSLVSLLDPKTAILVSTNSRLPGAEGKPILFVRRKIDAEIAKKIGVAPDKAQRIVLEHPAPIQSDGNKFGVGVFAYEQIVTAITNPKQIVVCADATE